MNTLLNRSFLNKFLKKLTEELKGEWILIGGTVMPLLQTKIRPTLDIDLISKNELSNQERIKLMSLAEDLKLPVEAINFAAEYFLKKIPDWEKELVLLQEGKKGKVYRPTANLFLLLKIDRFSESDLWDCLAMVNYAKKNKEPISQKTLKKINLELKKSTSPRKERILKLWEALNRTSPSPHPR